MNRNFCLSVAMAIAGVFACATQADSLFSRVEPERLNKLFDWGPIRLASTDLVNGRNLKGNWRAYRFQDDINGTTTGFGVGYMLQDTPISSWFGDNNRVWTGVHYDPRSVKVDFAVESKSWNYSPKMAGPSRFSDPDTQLINSEVTDRSYRIMFTIPF